MKLSGGKRDEEGKRKGREGREDIGRGQAAVKATTSVHLWP